MTEQDMLNTIIEYKKGIKFSDEKWVEYLGVSWGWWSRIKNGRRRLTNNFLAIIAAKCPDIQLEAFQYMRERGGDRSGV